MNWILDTEKAIPAPGFEEPWIQVPSTGYGLIFYNKLSTNLRKKYFQVFRIYVRKQETFLLLYVQQVVF
jgi:hypothetical protein